MPRIKPDMTILIRLKNETEFHKIEIFKKKEKIRIKSNGVWYKNKLYFFMNKLEKILFNTIKNKLYGE